MTPKPISGPSVVPLDHNVLGAMHVSYKRTDTVLVAIGEIPVALQHSHNSLHFRFKLKQERPQTVGLDETQCAQNVNNADLDTSS